MGQKEFLTRLGFSENPFQFTNADEEEHLQSYFVPPPYFESVWGEPESPSSQVIFAPRGGGKSAQRRMIEYRASKENVFAITYDRFEKLSGGDLPSLSIGYHLRNIIELALLGFLLECNSRRLGAPSFSNSEKSIIESLCRHYLGRITRLEALDASKSLRTLSTKAKETLRDWSGVLSALVSGALTAHGAPHITQPSFAPATATPDMDAPAKIHLEVVLNLVKSIGFKSVYVLIDKVDETSDTSNNAEASFLLVKPLLRDLQLLQLPGIGFKFFLWDKIQPFHSEYARPDRLQQFELSWRKDDMDTMLSKRLQAFSSGKVTNLSQLLTASLAKPLQLLVVLFASGSPRDMIRICQAILSEQLQINANSQTIGVEACATGISKFSQIRAKELLPPEVFRELVKVGRIDFTANYVANDIFKIEVNSARNKIVQWTKTGAVDKVGELHQGRKPVHQYAIVDIRVAMAAGQLDFSDFLKKKLRWCDSCSAVMVRDWDRAGEQTCSACGTEQRDPESKT
ncbi:MAG: P-loop ATPase, Sll1717 family [Candidatus Acidiferrales bacterium]